MIPTRLAAVCLSLLVVCPAMAQTAVPQTQSQIGPGGRRAGEQCIRRTDRIEGVVKVDACGRWYCGRVDFNDITVLNPNFAEGMKCSWTLVGDKCRCTQS